MGGISIENGGIAFPCRSGRCVSSYILLGSQDSSPVSGHSLEQLEMLSEGNCQHLLAPSVSTSGS